MQKKLIICVFLLFLSLIQIPSNLHGKDSLHNEWTFQPHTDRSVHVHLIVSVEADLIEYEISYLDPGIWIKNLAAYEHESHRSIQATIEYDTETDTQGIRVTFNEPTLDSFQFVIEFDAFDTLREEKEKVFILEWNFITYADKTYSAVVILPENAELLEVEYLNPRKVETIPHVSIYFSGTSSPDEAFHFSVIFSSTGQTYIQMGERYQQNEQYDLAITQFRNAKSFYNRFNLYKMDKSKILKQLQDRIFAIQKIQADLLFEEAGKSFSVQDWVTAEQKSEEAMNLYTIIEDPEGITACQALIDACRVKKEQKELAEELFQEGVQSFESEQYEAARESFSQSKALYEELGDLERVHECDEWILKCEESDMGLIFCIIGFCITLLWKRWS